MKEIIAIEASEQDVLYPRVNTDLAQQLVNIFKQKADGNVSLIDQDEFDNIVLGFAKTNNITPSGETTKEKVDSILEQVLGKQEHKAGGSLANSFYLMVSCKIDGAPVLQNANFYCTTGVDDAGQAFKKSLEGNIVATKEVGRTLRVHIIPTETGDIFMVASPSFKDSCDLHAQATVDAIRQKDFNNVGILMLGGYFHHSGKYDELVDVLVERLKLVDQARKPTVVLTAACNQIADGASIKSAITKLKDLANVIVLANAGEFRRLLGKDKDWRPTDRKPTDEEYQRANERALNYAHRKLPEVKFVVTNGEKAIHVVCRRGVSNGYEICKPIGIVDNTVGAGDAFAGGYLLGLQLALSEPQCVRLGSFAASNVICTKYSRLEVSEQGRFAGLLALLQDDPLNKMILNNIITKTQPEQSIEVRAVV